MDPGARNSLIVGAVGGLAVLAAAILLPPLAPLLALAAGLFAGPVYVHTTRRDLTGRAGQGGFICAPPVVLAQGLGTVLNLFVLGGGVRLGGRLSMLGATSEADLPIPMLAALIVLMVLLDLALVVVGAEFAARRAVAASGRAASSGAAGDPG